MITIREIQESDAAAFLAMQIKLDSETAFMMWESGERKTTVEEQTTRIRDILSSGVSMIWVLDDDGSIVGYLGGFGGRMRRNRHLAHIVIGMLTGYRGKGLGRRLFETMEQWAREKRFHRLELTVMIHNVAGIALYKKMGFEVEGARKHSLIIDGDYIDEYCMYKILA